MNVGCLSNAIKTKLEMQISLSLLHIYIEDMRTKKVNECAVTTERIVFS